MSRRLFIDESGSNTLHGLANPRHFLIGGAIATKEEGEFLKLRGDQIKFKYWGHTKVTFRGTNIRGLSRDFDIFLDKRDTSGALTQDNSARRDEFYAYFLRYIQTAEFKFICIHVNKDWWIAADPNVANAVKKGWLLTGFEKKLTRSMLEEIIKTYLCYLKTEVGDPVQIMVEAANIRQDSAILATYNEYMFGGMPAMGMSVAEVRDLLTCISFATKNNWDTETQMADVGTHFLGIKAQSDDGILGRTLTKFENDVITAFETKAFTDSCNALQPRSIRRL